MKMNTIQVPVCASVCLNKFCKLVTAGAIKSETSKKIPKKKGSFFFPDFLYMRCPCPFLQVDGVSLCLDGVLLSKSGILKK